ncbi:fimbrial protein [Proteiniphilum sp.]|uniref:fimbrial protein n=1 Tax=Proteiniphilum sp. TaxID=1926877 RepID=UPI002B221816|nr:fimbrial protein [Proteiniphilum sp.]MEA4916803.1 fimbrial assembly protein [Proteiniphilum sp.]
MKKIGLITLFAGLLFAACSSDDETNNLPTTNETITISYSVPRFGVEATTGMRAGTDPGSSAEQRVERLALFLYTIDGNAVDPDPKIYVISGATFTGGTWDKTDATGNEGTIKLSLKQGQAGQRYVYLVANYPSTMDLSAATYKNPNNLRIAQLGADTNPWSTIGTPVEGRTKAPLLMTGKTAGAHNFVSQPHLQTVSLIRAVAKVQLNIKLSQGYQDALTKGGNTQYKYRYVGFDRQTWFWKPDPKTTDATTSAWTGWSNELNTTVPTPDTGAGYKTASGKVTELSLTTYLNERDDLGAKIEIELPTVPIGPLPPPEFGPELYTLPLPGKIERNTWYSYDVTI